MTGSHAPIVGGLTVNARVAELLLTAADMSLDRRRELAAMYGTLRDGGLSATVAEASVAHVADVPVDLLRVAIHGSVWECMECGRVSFRLRGPVMVYVNGDAADECCLRRERKARAA